MTIERATLATAGRERRGPRMGAAGTNDAVGAGRPGRDSDGFDDPYERRRARWG